MFEGRTQAPQVASHLSVIPSVFRCQPLAVGQSVRSDARLEYPGGKRRVSLPSSYRPSSPERVAQQQLKSSLRLRWRRPASISAHWPSLRVSCPLCVSVSPPHRPRGRRRGPSQRMKSDVKKTSETWSTRLRNVRTRHQGR